MEKAHWNASNASVYYLNTSEKAQSRLDFYRRSTPSGAYCAITAMYVDTAQARIGCGPKSPSTPL